MLNLKSVKLILCVCSVFWTGVLNAQLQADFSSDITKGCSPVFVKFSDQSTGNPTSWFWDLGNGSTSTERNPTTFYFEAGKYTVSLTVVRGSDTQRIVKDQFIIVNDAPILNFTVSDSVGCFPLNVTFTDLTDPQSSGIQNLQWDFGDGTFSDSSVAKHTYNVAGNFTVSLKITNSFGCTRLISRPAFIKVLEGVKANFNYFAGLTCNPPAVIQFNNTSTGKNITEYLWNFGDGSTEITKNPQHNYTSQGKFTVSLSVKNSAGCTDKIEKENVVQVGSVKADFQAPDTVCRQTAVKFINLSDPAPVTVLWTFGDGTTSKVISPSKTYANPGTYKVTLQSNFGGCTSTTSRNITVLPAPSANFTTGTITSTCSLPITLEFHNSDASVQKYEWSFGDGQQSTEANPSHLYNSPGSYSVSLTATGFNGCQSKVVKPNLVYFGPPVIQKFKDLPYKGCTPQTINFAATIASPEPIVSYLWNFGDSTTSTEASPVHAYSNPGNYNVSLDIVTVNGCKASYTLEDAVVLSTKPLASFSAKPRDVCAFEKVFFSSDSSQGTITSYIWNFGDGGSSNEQNPVYAYRDTGDFNVTLIASNNACTDTLQLTKYMHIEPPIAKFEPVSSCDDPSKKVFTDKSIGAESWNWNFGDSTSSTDQNPAHTFDKSGTYPVRLEVTNGSCKHVTTSMVQVINENPVIEVENNSSCKNALTRFKATRVDTAFISQYQWDFGDGKTVTTSLPSVEYAYKTSGKFKPLLTIIDKNGCKKTVRADIDISIEGPQADFSILANTCVQKPVAFSDKSTWSTGQPVEKWIWNFGDNHIDTLTNASFNYTYQKAGTYNVSLVVVDAIGCRDTLSKKAAVIITNPIAAFSITDSLNCTLKEVRFDNASEGLNLKYNWDLGDGTFSRQKDVVHNYSKEADYNIKLVITDTFGCTDSLTRTNGVKVANVKARMVLSDSISSCPPIIMTLWNKSENYSSIIWDFNDGSFSNLDTPSHYYNVPGVYNIKLIALGYGDCADTLVRTISLKGPSGELKYKGGVLCSPGVATFRATTINKASFVWDFGDGTTEATTDSLVHHTYVNPGRYRPKLVLEDVAGCKVPIIGKDTITITKADANIRNVHSTYCDSTSVQFYDSSFASMDVITKYKWMFGDGTVDSVNRNPRHVYATTGNYAVRLQVTTSKGCSNMDSLDTRLRVIKSPVINISGDDGVCPGEPVTFKANVLRPDTSALRWAWNFGNGETASVQAPDARQFANPGRYNINATAVNSSGCASTAAFALQVYPTPNISAGKDTLLCFGQSLTLRATGGQMYRWANNADLSCTNCANPVIKPANNSTYYVAGTSEYGCKNGDSIRIQVVQPFRSTVSNSDTMCLGESVQLTATGSDNYQWTPTTGLSNASIANPIARPVKSTVYQVIISDKYKCFVDTASVSVKVYPLPEFKIEPTDLTISNGDSVKIETAQSLDVNHWRWVPYKGLSCHNCPEPVASPQTTTTYLAQAWNDGGCKTEDRVTISVLCNNANIFIPNTFSPNGDGMNDVFFVRGKGIASIKAITIFNRWGAVVFQKNNININDAVNGWNGTYNNAPLSPDVYVYKVDVVCENNSVISLKGNITLIR